MMVPVSSGAAGAEGCFETAVETFHQTVGLGVIGSGGLVRDIEVRAERDPQVRGELWSTVRGDSVWHTKTGDPMMDQNGGAVCHRGGGQGNGLRPTGSSVNNGEEVGVARRGGEGPNQVNMDMRETGHGERNGRRLKMSMAVDFRRLTGKTGTAPQGYIFGQMRPDITGREEPAGSPGARVSKAMNMLKKDMSESLRNKRAKNGSGDITQERRVPEHVGANTKMRRKLESLYLRTGNLLLSLVKRRKGRSDRK